MNKDVIWKEIVAHERKISEGLQQPGAEEYARELHELTQGYFTSTTFAARWGTSGFPMVGFRPPTRLQLPHRPPIKVALISCKRAGDTSAGRCSTTM